METVASHRVGFIISLLVCASHFRSLSIETCDKHIIFPLLRLPCQFCGNKKIHFWFPHGATVISFFNQTNIHLPKQKVSFQIRIKNPRIYYDLCINHCKRRSCITQLRVAAKQSIAFHQKEMWAWDSSVTKQKKQPSPIMNYIELDLRTLF